MCARGPGRARSSTPGAVFIPEQTIRDYLYNRPEPIIEMLQEAKEMQRRTNERQASQALTARQSELPDDPTSPVAGNPKARHLGDVG
jgi:hypothetical protein